MPCKIMKVYEGRDVKEVIRNDEVFRLISAETVKGKYSISAKYNDAFILKSLYDLGLDVVFDECVDIIIEYRELLQKMVDAGVPAKSATSKAKKEAFDKVQAQYIDKLGKKEYLDIFPMVDKTKAKSTKQRKKEQVREVKSKISDIKKLKKELELPPEVTQPDEDLVSQINNAIANDETLEALKDTRDIDALKVEKAKLEIPDIELSIDLPMGGMDNGEVKKNEVELPKATVEVEEVCEKPYYEKAAEKIIEFDDDLESFFADNDDLF